MHSSIEQLAIFGPGLIGGSIALAARRAGICARLSIWSPAEAERKALRAMDLANLVTQDLAAAAAGSDLVLLCTPPGAMATLAEQIAPHLAPGAVVSDVASVKAGVAENLSRIFGPRYAGAHPMAGAEQHGLAAARANLFDGSVCLLTPDDATAPDALETVRLFWCALGARPVVLTPGDHDAAVALVSHLPHVLAAALVDFVGKQEGDPTACAGPGWRDMTRLAGGSPELWTEILSRNRKPVTYALRGLIDKLQTVVEVMETGRDAELEAFLAGAKIRRGSSLAAGR